MKTHPYLADHPVFDDEVESIAESIAEVGLLHPVTLDTEGRIIGGRHRLAACEKVGIEPTFETYDGDPLAFVLHDNATRKHQTTGQRAAENALSLDKAGRRVNGRWKRGSVPDDMRDSSHNAWRKALEQVGLVLDHFGRDGLIQVANDDLRLNDAYERACQARDGERLRLEEEERIAAEEADALAALPREYADQIGSTYSSARVAFAAWEDANRAEAARLRREKAEKEREQKEIEDGIRSTVTRIAECVRHLDGGADQAAIYLRDFHPHDHRFLAQGMRLTRDRVDSAIDFLTTISKELHA